MGHQLLHPQHSVPRAGHKARRTGSNHCQIPRTELGEGCVCVLQGWGEGDRQGELMPSLLEMDYPWWLVEKEKEILTVKNGGRFPAGSLESLDIKLTLIWYSVKRQGRRTQIGKGLIRALVNPPRRHLASELGSPHPHEEAGKD